jgi:hypothetical protein
MRAKRGFAGAVAVAVVLAGVVVGTAMPGSAAGVQPCKDVSFFGLAGSGQHKDDPRAFGPQVWFAMEAIKKAVTDLEYAEFSMPYEAAGLEVLNPTRMQVAGMGTAAAIIATTPPNPLAWTNYLVSSAVGGVAFRSYVSTKAVTFLRSMDAGTANLTLSVSNRATACPDEAFVLIGYSQGAGSIHRYLNDLENEGDQDTMDRIAAVVLIADPDRLPNGSPATAGSADAGSRGIELWLPKSIAKSVTKRNITDISEYMAEVTVSVCDEGDLVCDFTPRHVVKGRQASMTTHSGYIENPDDPDVAKRTYSTAVQQAVQFVSEIL